MIYGDDGPSYGKNKKETMVEGDSSDVEYVEPARSSYPEDKGIMGNFGGAARPKRG